MPIFISYSHQDKAFAHTLGANLFKNKTTVWIDDWEVSAGESLIEKIQSALQESAALIVVLSKASVESVWCKKEVIAGIQRELEEKKVLVIPALLEDCTIPLFLRDKKYADFRTDFDDGLSSIIQAVAKVANPHLGRVENDDYKTDWSMDWFTLDELFGMRFTLAQHSVKWPYTVISEITILCNEHATRRYNLYRDNDLAEYGQFVIVTFIVSALSETEFFIVLEDNLQQTKDVTVVDKKLGMEYVLHLESRRLGEDNGMDIVMNATDEIRKIWDMTKRRVKELTNEEKVRIMSIISKGIAK